jgi:thiamine-phosphate pyrophosphorylase
VTTCDISLYAILDPARCRGRPLGDMARAAAIGGATLMQYRDKTASTRAMILRAIEIRAALAGSGVPLLINDRVDVALAVGANGVHVGQDDMAAHDARRLLGEGAIIGLTIKNARQAEQAPLDRIDYACIGGVYQTLSKDNPSAIGVEGWQQAAAPLRASAAAFPVGAIAGIDATNAAAVLRGGADGVAVISALFMADDVEQATRELKAIVQSTLAERV